MLEETNPYIPQTFDKNKILQLTFTLGYVDNPVRMF